MNIFHSNKPAQQLYAELGRKVFMDSAKAAGMMVSYKWTNDQLFSKFEALRDRINP
jgi:hypothetical protein